MQLCLPEGGHGDDGVPERRGDGGKRGVGFALGNKQCGKLEMCTENAS